MRKDINELVKKYQGKESYLLNKSELARRYGCDPRTISRYMKIESGEIIPQRSKRTYQSLIDDYKETIINKVDVYGATAMAVYKFIQKKGYKGKYSSVATFVKKHKDSETQKATIRFETSPGLQAQVDWKEDLKLISKHGEIYKVNIFLMVLGYSRVKYVCLTSNRKQDTLFQCLIDGFKYFGGIPDEILFDNMKTVIDRSKSTFSRIELNERFSYFMKDAGFKTLACRAYRPQTKGKVEALSKLTSRLVVYNEEFDDYKDLEDIVNEFMHDINFEISQATGEIPLERLKKEQEYLNPLTPVEILLSYVSRKKEYKVSKDSMVLYKGKKYSVPTKYINKKLSITEQNDGNIYLHYNGDVIVCHSLGDKKFNYKHKHMHEILKSDACKHLNDSEIERFIEQNISMMDTYLGE